jgi:disulfide bond formation protein DsbB
MRLAPLPLAVLVLSSLVIGGALVFEYGVGLVPCELCLYERWPWYAAIAIAVLLLTIRPSQQAPLLFGALFLASLALAFYHVGVEHHLFAGPDACTGPALHGQTIEELTRQLMAAPVIRCDEPQWSLFGVSLAGWNLVASLLVLVLAIRAGRRARAA